MKGFWSKKVPACLVALAMMAALVPAASAAWYDLEASVDAGDEVTFKRSEFRDIYGHEYRYNDFHHLVFTDDGNLDDYGYFVAYDENGDEETFGEGDFQYIWFCYYTGDISSNQDYTLDGLTFVADDDAPSGTLEMEFSLWDEDDDDSVAGTLYIDVDGGRSSSSKLKITYEVDPDDDVTLDARDFRDLFEDESSDDFECLDFYSYDDFDDYGYFEARDFYGDWDELYDSSLDDGWFYYGWEETTDHDDHGLSGMTFYAYRDADEDTLEFPFTMYGDDGDSIDGTLYIEIGRGSGTSSSKADIVYEVEPSDDVTFDRYDFWDFLDDETGDDLEYVVFTAYDDFDDLGYFYADGIVDDDDVRDYDLYESDLDDGWFYYSSGDVDVSYDFELDTLTFAADRNTDGESFTLDFTAYGSDDEAEGTVEIRIGDGASHGAQVKGDIVYEMDVSDDLTLDPDDFWDFLDDETGEDLDYVVFTDYNGFDDFGFFYADGYDYDEFTRDYELNEADLDDAVFYYDPADVYDDYEFELETLTFASDRDADGQVVTLEFTAYGGRDEADGTVAIAIGDVTGAAADESGDIVYYADYSSRVQINANDIARFFRESYPSATFQYATIDEVPSTGSLYYNYYSTSDHGVSTSLHLTDAICEDTSFYFSPSGNQYALGELTYVPNGVNYCARIPFTAHGSGSRSVSGTILISVNLSTVPDVYGPTPVNTSVSFPAASLAAAVSQASGLTLSSIQLLELPAAGEGVIYVGTGTSKRADTDTLYGYTTGTERISQLRFVPASGFTGSVEIPYVACNANGGAIASGKLCLGVVREMEDFSDITSSTWCYKYVLELSDAGVIDGYTDGTFKPNSQVTYGAALKLIMLAAGYAEQSPVDSNVFSGYLARARQDGLVSGNVDLSAPITRLAVSQIAAKAMDLSITNLSSVRPFTDTSDPYVQALNAAGIVEGYFNNGTSTFKPYNTLTRGQISAIIWRMEQAQ